MTKERIAHGKSEEEQRLMKLFWNRAELKKEFKKLRDDRYKLEDELKQQKAATLRAVNKLESIERLFSNPEAGFNIIVYFQLRNLWRTCRAELQKFASELYKQQEHRERQRQVMLFNQERGKRLAAVAEKIATAKAEISNRDLEIKALHAQIESLRGFWNYFKRRQLRQELEAKMAARIPLQDSVRALQKKETEMAQESAPNYEGVSNAGKRTVNLAIIGLAQQMQLHFSKSSLADMSKAAMIRPIEETKYGTRQDCVRLMEAIPEAISAMKAEKSFSGYLKQRTQALKAAATYLSDGDTIPQAESLDAVMIEASGRSTSVGGSKAAVNVLADEYWDLYSALIR